MSAHPSSSATSSAEMVTALVRLREALAGVALPLDVPAAEEHRKLRGEMVDQLEDYVLPRLIQIEAPLLTVVGGSTGAGKSTLVNSLVGRRVTEPGVLRPTTRSPVPTNSCQRASTSPRSRLPSAEASSTFSIASS